MNNLIDDAKEIIEMSLKSDANMSDYSLKATDWLKRFEAVQKGHQEKQTLGQVLCQPFPANQGRLRKQSRISTRPFLE